SVSETSLPLVALSNQTSVQLLSADKSFKDYLTTQNAERMSAMRTEFAASQNSFSEVLSRLEAASQNNASLIERIAQLS
ncbi:methyl-accepting chemotaxis protein, partial [Vibrio lentus]|nr:methyl-accepting chemotaxis protein [Vibrio lentus]